MWFQNRRAKWRKKEHTKKGPGRPAHNAHPQSCSGEPIPPEELRRKERERRQKKLLKALERQQRKLAAKVSCVCIRWYLQIHNKKKSLFRDNHKNVYTHLPDDSTLKKYSHANRIRSHILELTILIHILTVHSQMKLFVSYLRLITKVETWRLSLLWVRSKLKC